MNALMSSSTPPRRTSNSCVNLPIHFASGSFAGQAIRAELTEIQKADLGRKYAVLVPIITSLTLSWVLDMQG